MSRPPTGLLQEESALAVEAALGVALRHLQQHGLLSDGKPLDWDMAFSLLAGIIEVRNMRLKQVSPGLSPQGKTNGEGGQLRAGGLFNTAAL